MSKQTERALPAVTGGLVTGGLRTPGGLRTREEVGAGQHFEDRDLMRGKVPKDQFAPSEAEPVRQRYKMGGGC